MEPLFENIVTWDYETHKDSNVLLLFKTKNVKLLIVDGVFFPLLCLICFFLFESWYYLVFIFIFLASTIYKVIRGTYGSAKLELKRDLEFNNGDCIVRKTSMYEDTVELEISTGSKCSYKLSVVKKAIQNKKFIGLITEGKIVILFKKDSFTKGTPEELINFLKNYGIKVK